jgi:hypothetical protein
MLAQEGIELIRFMRDYNWLKCDSQDWKTGLANGSYVIDMNTEWSDCDLGRTLIASPPANSRLYIQPDGSFIHSSGTPSIFSRTVQITQVSADELRVEVQVYWNNKRGTTQSGCPSGTSCARVESHLYNWR